MTHILCIETATTNCSVALSQNGSVIAFVEDNPENTLGKKFSHAEKLHHYIDQVLNEANVSRTAISAIAISKGPGSYTGLRIGVSAAKGLCFALNIPLLSISTLASLAHQEKDAIVKIPMLDARRMEVYAAIFDAKNQQIRETQAQIIDENSFKHYLDAGKVAFIGDGVAKFASLCEHKNAMFKPNVLPSAQQMCALAYVKFQEKDFEDVAYFEPYYLKDFLVNGGV